MNAEPRGSEGNDVGTREDKMKRLNEAEGLVAEQVYEDLNEQTKLVAANVLAIYGDKSLFNAQGYILSLQKVATATLLWLLSEDYVELAEKAKVGEDELAKRREAKLGKIPASAGEQRDIGNYL